MNAISNTQKTILKKITEGYTLEHIYIKGGNIENIFLERSRVLFDVEQQDDFFVDNIKFVGQKPTIITDEALFLRKGSYSHDPESFYQKGLLQSIDSETRWHSIDKNEADYYTMVLDHGEFSFFPSWEKEYMKDEKEIGELYHF